MLFLLPEGKRIMKAPPPPHGCRKVSREGWFIKRFHKSLVRLLFLHKGVDRFQRAFWGLGSGMNGHGLSYPLRRLFGCKDLTVKLGEMKPRMWTSAHFIPVMPKCHASMNLAVVLLAVRLFAQGVPFQHCDPEEDSPKPLNRIPTNP